MNQENYYASLRAIANAPVSTNDQRPAVGASNGRWDAIPAWRYRRAPAPSDPFIDFAFACALAPLAPFLICGAVAAAFMRR
jgi:hypothetical protein